MQRPGRRCAGCWPVGRVLTLVVVLAGLLLASVAGVARADVVWLCEPGMQDNPCRDNLETTVYSPSGESRVENPPLPADPPVDCFYVYPTVSEQPSSNANKDVDPELIAIARAQAARFSQTCRVYAPVYRQQTLAGVGAGGSSQALKLAYGDVLEAWRAYLAQKNRGRGFVLIGHSQGTRMLRRLLREEIDPRPELRGRLVSAVLPGANVTVRKGQKAGGDFQNVPACSRAGEVGCVIAFSTYYDPPPPNSRFGRVPAEDTSGFGLPVGPDFEALCTNPASLDANARVPLTTYARSEPFPGFIGALVVQTYGGPPPSAPTTWLQPQDHYTGRCEQIDGANVLKLEPIANARRLNPAPDPTWGVHILDGNIALGEFVEVAAQQASAYVRATAEVEPRLALALAYRRGRTGRDRPCARSPIRASLLGLDAAGLRSVEFRVNGRRVKFDRSAPFRTVIRGSRRRIGRSTRIGARAVFADGRRARFTRRLRAC